jgi:NADPH:quinone reductase-like Zn-dependent oxidoreductase
MKAAVVRSFDHPPRYEEFAAPQPAEGQVQVEMLAAGLHPRVRSGANGSHYTSDQQLPMIPGVDGVGRLPDGRTLYFVADDDDLGTMASEAVVDPRRSVEIPAGVDPVLIAAAMNPAMSSWVALRRRISFAPGQSVLVLGKQLTWIQIGSMAGLEINLPSFVLRAANLQLIGSGQGSVSAAGIVAELPSLIALLAAGTLTVDPLAVPLSEVETAWAAPTRPGQRVVLTP